MDANERPEDTTGEVTNGHTRVVEILEIIRAAQRAAHLQSSQEARGADAGTTFGVRTPPDIPLLERLIEELGGAGADVVPALLACLADTSQTAAMRCFAIKLLGETGDVRAIDPLMGALEVPVLKQRAVSALVRIGEPAIKPLHRGLQIGLVIRVASDLLGNPSEKEMALCCIAEALGRLQATEAVDDLILLLRGISNLENRCEWKAAQKALARIGKPAVAPLIELFALPTESSMQDVLLFKSPNSSIQFRAMQALVKIGEPAVPPLCAALERSERAFRQKRAYPGNYRFCSWPEETLIRIGTPAIPALIDMLSLVPDSQAMAIKILKEMRTLAVRPLLKVLEQRGGAYLVYGAKQALKEIGGAAVLPAVEALDQKLNAMRAEGDADSLLDTAVDLVELLGKLKDTRAVPALLNALNGGDVRLRSTIVAALGETRDPRGIIPLCAALKDLDPSIRTEAKKALQKFPTEFNLATYVLLCKHMSPSEKMGALVAWQQNRPRVGPHPSLNAAIKEARHNCRFVLNANHFYIPELREEARKVGKLLDDYAYHSTLPRAGDAPYHFTMEELLRPSAEQSHPNAEAELLRGSSRSTPPATDPEPKPGTLFERIRRWFS